MISGPAAKPDAPCIQTQAFWLVLRQDKIGGDGAETQILGCLVAEVAGDGRGRKDLGDQDRCRGGEISEFPANRINDDIRVATVFGSILTAKSEVKVIHRVPASLLSKALRVAALTSA